MRFPLEMENGITVRSLEELRDNFSFERVMSYYLDGRLVTWLSDRYLDELAQQIQELDKHSNSLAQGLCEILGVTYQPTDINLQDIENKTERLAKLKEYTMDERIWDKIDIVAFNQDELLDIIDEGKTEIFLCGERFEIPLSKHGIHYIGLSMPTAVILSSQKVDFEKYDIKFTNIKFDEKYQMLVDEIERKNMPAKRSNLELDFYRLQGNDLLERLEKEIEIESSLADKARYMLYTWWKHTYTPDSSELNIREQLLIASQHGYKAAEFRYVIDCSNDDDEKQQLFKKWTEGTYITMHDMQDSFIKYELAVAYLQNQETYNKSIELLEQVSDEGYWMADISLALRYENGQGVSQSWRKANECYKKASERNLTFAYEYMAWNELFIIKNDYKEGEAYLKSAAEDEVFLSGFKNNVINEINNPYKINISPGYIYFGIFDSGTMEEAKRSIKNNLHTMISEIKKFFSFQNDELKAQYESCCNNFRYLYKRILIVAYMEKRLETVQGYLKTDQELNQDIQNLFNNVMRQSASDFQKSQQELERIYSDHIGVEISEDDMMNQWKGLFDPKQYDVRGNFNELENDYKQAAERFSNDLDSTYKTYISDLYNSL